MSYTKIKELGKGGMGSVWLCEDDYGRKVAVKTLRSEMSYNPDFRELFDAEARTLSKMNNPSVVRILGNTFYDDNGDLCLPMEFVEGETLTHIIRANGPFSEDVAIDYMSKILDALDYIHSVGNIHRDIKPSNIMIRPDNSICVIDFGIAKDMKTHTGKTVGRIIGTDGYMSPEQAKGDSVDYRTDIYSLGCVFYYMLTGKDAIVKQSNDFETATVILEDNFPKVRDANPNVSERIQNVILKAVDKNMMKRYHTAADFKRALGGTVISDNVEVSIGRVKGDIIISSQYVSGSHLKIEYRTSYSNNENKGILVITDTSTNGTGIDGRFLKHGTYSFDYQHGVTPISSLPEVYLAGRAELRLDWNRVIATLVEKGMTEFKTIDHETVQVPGHVTGQETSSFSDANTGAPTTPEAKDNDSLEAIEGIVSFLIPIYGIIRWAQWKTIYPQKARSAGLLGLGGFILSLILTIMSNL